MTSSGVQSADPRITTEVYGHLVPDFLRAEIDRLHFGIAPPPKPSSDSPPSAAVPTALQPGPSAASDGKTGPAPANDSNDFDGWARRDSNPRPPASEAGTLSN